MKEYGRENLREWERLGREEERDFREIERDCERFKEIRMRENNFKIYYRYFNKLLTVNNKEYPNNN